MVGQLSTNEEKAPLPLPLPSHVPVYSTYPALPHGVLSFRDIQSYARSIIAGEGQDVENTLYRLVRHFAILGQMREDGDGEEIYSNGLITMRNVERAKKRVKEWLSRVLPCEDFFECEGNPLYLVHEAQVVYTEDGHAYSMSYGEDNTFCCDNCGSRYDAERRHESGGGSSLCSDCFCETSWVCNHCDSVNDRDDWACDGCGRNQDGEDDSEGLHEYSTDVLDKLDGFKAASARDRRDAKGLYFGVELEVCPKGNRSDAIEATQEALENFAILKEDGSLSDGGFEIVTVPATLEFHRERLWKGFFAKGGAAENLHAWDTTCCGLHVHFSREAVTNMQMGKMLVFFNNLENSAFLTDIAGREVSRESQYCNQRPEAKSKVRYYNQSDCGHYEALSISRHTDGKTGEVRIFRGNVTKHGVMRAIEFVAAVIEWSKEASVRKLTSWGFLSWFDRPVNRARFPELWKQLLAKKLLSTRHTFKVVAGTDYQEAA